jgi:diketogulonate reductase-like aldo/keto reductase
VASALPNIYDEKQLSEFAAAADTLALTDDEMDRIQSLYQNNFGIEEDAPKFKGTMELVGRAQDGNQ